MKWGGWTDSHLRRWMGAAVLLLLVALAGHFIGGRSWDIVWLLLSIAAAVVLVVGTYRHPGSNQ